MKPGAILASNTSSISITKLAGAVSRPAQVIGMHFMNPVPLMKLVEIIRALPTSQETYDTTRDLAAKLGKTVITSRDQPGFVVNRMLVPFLNEACFVLQEGLASPEDIDEGARLGSQPSHGAARARRLHRTRHLARDRRGLASRFRR